MLKKECRGCKVEFSFSSFYKHPKTKDGYDTICKSCVKEKYKNDRALKSLDPFWLEKERKRQREKYHRFKNKWKKSSNNKLKQTNDKYYKKYPEKLKAKRVSQYLKIPKGLEKHHWSYNEEHYKDVLCLSTTEHNKLHRYLEYDKCNFYYKCKLTIGKFKKGDILDTKLKHSEYYLLLKNKD